MTAGRAALGVVGLAAGLGLAYLTVRPAALPPSSPTPAVTRGGTHQGATPSPGSSSERRRVQQAPSPAPMKAQSISLALSTYAEPQPLEDGPRGMPAVANPISSIPAAAVASAPVPAGVFAAPASTPAAPESSTPTAPSPRADDQSARAVKIKKDVVIGVRLDRTVSTETARVDDKVTARVARDVLVEDRIAIAAGARLEGVVTIVERGTHPADRGRLGIRFTTLILADNKRVAIQTDTIIREGDPGREPASASASAALGVMLAGGGRRGDLAPAPHSATPPTPGAGKDARIPAGSPLTVKLIAAISIDRDE